MSDAISFLIPISAILGFWAYMIVVSQARARVKEAQIRERIALIEKGMMPAPEVDPRGFERAVGRYDRHTNRTSKRHRSAGVTLIAVGIGLMWLIGFAGEEPKSAIGVGGFIVMLGMAFLVNSQLDRRQAESDTPPNASQPATSQTESGRPD